MSEIKVNSVVNSTGDNDSGLDLSTNDQVIIKTANTTAVTVDSSQNTSVSGDLTIPDKIIHSGDTNTAIRFPSADTISFENGGSESARVDSSGNLLVGTTDSNLADNSSDTSADNGIALTNDAKLMATRNNGTPVFFNRCSSDGTITEFRRSGSAIGAIGVASSTVALHGGGTGAEACGFIFVKSSSTPRIVPCQQNFTSNDDVVDLGHSSNRFDDIFATNGTIQTSDRNDKQDIEELSDAEQRVAVVAKGLMRKYRWKDKVAEKGDNARTHFGIIAQDLQDAFTAEGLDAGDYAMFISDTWWEKEISVDAVEADEENGIEAKDAYTYMDIKEEETEGYTERTRLGVRYSELLAFIISAL